MTDDTCWTVIHEAARGDRAARARFATLYHDALRAYLVARWRGGPLMQELDDAVQDVYFECAALLGLLGAD